jgi:protein O-GlcNAc transferase
MDREHHGSHVPSGPGVGELAFQGALALRKQGHSHRADALCAGLLQTDPNHFDACHLRGLIALEMGDMDRGIEFIERSLAINPNQPLAHSNLGNALLTVGQPLRALDSLDQALRLKSDLSIAHYNRGNALKALGRAEQALASYDAALRVDGSHAKTLNNRGVVLQELGRLKEARSSFEQASKLDPRFAAPGKNLAVVLLRLELPREALAVSERVLEREPDDPQANCARGNALLALERLDAAIECYTRALQIDPECVEALLNRAAVWQRLKCLEAAAQAFEGLLRIQPDNPAALGNLFHLRMEQCDWHDYADLSARAFESLRRTERFVNPLSLLLHDDSEINLSCARAFVGQRFSPQQSLGAFPPPASLRGRERIRVAYVSADFADHPVAHLMVGVLERHDRERFEVIGVSLRSRGSGPLERRVHGALDKYVDAAAISDRDLAQSMRAWGVDIAVDLMGFTDGSRQGIFAHRAAPVQVNYLGYAGTTGAPFMDYLLGDAVVIPSGDDHWYSEKVVRLPDCYLPTDDKCAVDDAPTRIQAGLPQRGFVFCAFTKAHKINPRVFEIWMRLLRQTEGGVLWLGDLGGAARENLLREAERFGVERGRLVFAPRVAGRSEHLARQALADLYLDTLPYNAHSTACDALWAGVPVLTCKGSGFASRVAASALAAAGLPELVTSSVEEYERRALDLAQRPERLQVLRSRLKPQDKRLPLFDTARYTGHLEAAFRRMHDRALRGEPAASFSVEAEFPGA